MEVAGIVGWWRLGGGGFVKVRRLGKVSLGIRRAGGLVIEIKDARVGVVGRKVVQGNMGEIVRETSGPVLKGRSTGHGRGCSRIL